MKRFVTLAAIFALVGTGNVHAQILKKFKDKVKEKAEQKADQKVDEAAQKTVDAPEEAMKKKKKNTDGKTEETTTNKTATTASTDTKKSDVDYGSFDFVPGDSVLFEDEFVNESVNEIPSLWQLSEGKAEIVKVDGKNVVGFLTKSSIYPRMKKYNYLPKRFTLEFDFLNKEFSGKNVEEASAAGPGRMGVKFYGDEDDNMATGSFREWINISNHGDMYFGENYHGTYENDTRKKETDLFNKWVHVSIAVTETNLKAYINSTRVLNAPVKSNSHAASITIQGETQNWNEGNMMFIRNVRIAGGLKPPYKQDTSEIPKTFIARGIKFDYQLATLKPESMGELNNVIAILKDHPEAKYEIGGHTSKAGNGATAANQKLSVERAKAVKDKLVNMGIDAARLTTKGYGEAKPIADNTTPEGRANNQRVEFTLIK